MKRPLAKGQVETLSSRMMPRLIVPTPDLRATDVLANERTLLAYVRTALALIGFGFVIARFGLFVNEIAAVTHIASSSPHFSTAFGVTMALAGIAIGLIGGWRYAVTDTDLRRGVVRPLSSAAAYVLSIAVAAIGLIVAALLIAYR
jgi:putative membrane protein